MTPNAAFFAAIYVLGCGAALAVFALGWCIERRRPWPLRVLALLAFVMLLAIIAEAPRWTDLGILRPAGYMEPDTGCLVSTIKQERTCGP